MKVKAIETNFKGYRMRSRLEARWAVFFEVLQISWEYEKEGFNLGDGVYYLPDFYLPTVGLRSDIDNLGLWVEIKPTKYNYKDPNNYGKKLRKFVDGSNHNLVLLIGVPDIDKEDNYEFSPGRWDNYMQFMKCYNPDCGYVKLEYMEGNYMYCPKCRANSSADHPLVVKAIYAAKGARFEHGHKN